MELFNLIKVIFTNPEEYSLVAPGEKRKYYFICQRRFAINFPLQANALQHLKINQVAVIDFWQRFLRKQYKFVPGWMYTKGIKKSKEIKEKKQNINSELINEYCKKFEIDSKVIKDALEFYPEEITKEIKEFEKILKQK
jgi:hypothetical protein